MNIRHYILLLSLFALASCSSTKGLSPSEKLFTGTKVSFDDKDNVKNKRRLKIALDAAKTLPDAAGFFNIKRGFYNVYDSVGTSSFKHIVKNRMGAKPKIYNSQMETNTEARMSKIMKDFGYFKSDVKCDSVVEKRKVNLDCHIVSGPRYKIGKIVYPYDTLNVSKVVKQYHPLQYLKSGDYYRQQNVANERAKIISTAKNNGFVYFDSRDLYFYLDTLKGQSLVDLYVEIKASKDATKQTRFVIGKTKVDTKYSLNNQDTIQYQEDKTTGLFFSTEEGFVKKSFIDRMLVQQEGEYASDRKQRLSSNRLLDLGIFKFVRNEMSIVNNDTLNQKYLLTPAVTKTITGELELNNRTGNFFGTQGSVSFINKNVFKGAERFKVGLSGGIETQFGEENFINTRQVKFSTSLEIPRLILPIIRPKRSKYFVPWTIISGGVNFQRRTSYFNINDFQLKFGYRWQESKNRYHEFYPADFNNFYVYGIDSTFQARLEQPNNIRLRESFEDKLVLGMRYAYTYNNAPDAGARNSWYLKSEILSAGNTYALVEKVIPSLKSNFSNRVSQFIKMTIDMRKHWSLGDSDIATRFYAGAGFAFGRSNQMPYSEHFSIGGSNSLRAFSLRTIGPGNYIGDILNEDSQYIDQTGDVKLEMNAEYRFPMAGFLKGAVFLDAGNVWLLERGTESGQRFVVEDFYKHIGLGTGFGFRFDFDFFVFRLDLGVPLHGPIGGEFKWLDTFNPISQSWRRDHIKWNLGIGYPF